MAAGTEEGESLWRPTPAPTPSHGQEETESHMGGGTKEGEWKSERKRGKIEERGEIGADKEVGTEKKEREREKKEERG